MNTFIRIEDIGVKPQANINGFWSMALCPEMYKSRAWVAKITGIDSKYGLSRIFLNPSNDYTFSNSKCSRGLYKEYIVSYNTIYDISAPTSWRNTDRYFCIFGENGKTILSKERVISCLKSE